MMTDDQKEPRRGRPPADEPRSTVSTWLPASTHDRLIKRANEEEQSVSEFVREMIEERLEQSPF